MKDIDLPSIGTAIGIIAGLWAFAKIILKPVVQALWREVHAEEVKTWNDTAKLSQANSDRLEWIEASLLAKGRDHDRIEMRLEQLGDAVNRLCGRMDQPWDGKTERRHVIRRHEDDEERAS